MESTVSKTSPIHSASKYVGIFAGVTARAGKDIAKVCVKVAKGTCGLVSCKKGEAVPEPEADVESEVAEAPAAEADPAPEAEVEPAPAEEPEADDPDPSEA